MIEKESLLRKYGFYRTLTLLPTDGSKLLLMEFYEKLNKTDYYTMFVRVRKELLQKEVISIQYDANKKRKTIHLTKNGIILKLRLKWIIQQLDNPYNDFESKKDIEQELFEKVTQAIRNTIKRAILEDTNYLMNISQAIRNTI